MQVLRNREELEYEIELQPLQTLVPVHKYDQLPSYFIYAGGHIATRDGSKCTLGHSAMVSWAHSRAVVRCIPCHTAA
jgi:hypothetical protein